MPGRAGQELGGSRILPVTTFRSAVEALPTRDLDSVGHEIARGAPGASPEDLARLTEVLAASGASIGKPSAERIDIASTGGPGSLTTLLAPLAAASGARVSKIAVPGRPAGGIDTLGSISGYRTELSLEDARAVLESCGYLHTMAGGHFCPLDAAFFEWRRENGAQAIPELAIASLLSKKLAAGVGRVVLDIRVGPHGNFGRDPAAASASARRFVEVANILGVDAGYCLSGVSGVPQPYIGRGEALLAVDQAIGGTASGWLLQHVQDCLALASIAIGRSTGQEDATLAGAAQAHESMLCEHGVELREYNEHVERVRLASRVEIVAQDAGYVALDIDGIRSVLVDRQRAAPSSAGARFSDPCGLILNANIGDWISNGHLLASVRDHRDPQTLGELLSLYIKTVQEPSVQHMDEIMEVIW